MTPVQYMLSVSSGWKAAWVWKYPVCLVRHLIYCISLSFSLTSMPPVQRLPERWDVAAIASHSGSHVMQCQWFTEDLWLDLPGALWKFQPYDFCNIAHTRHAFTRPETNTCYGNNLDNPRIVPLEECRPLTQRFRPPEQRCSALCRTKFTGAFCSWRTALLLLRPDASVRDQSLIRAADMTAKRSSPGLGHPGELRCAGLCYQPSKDSPLILFHVSWSNRTPAPPPTGLKALAVEHSRKETRYAHLKRSF